MESGARAAISGYRRQALYTAHLLTQKDSESRVLHPEGREDLAVYLDDRLEQTIQVKAYSSPLTLSDLKPAKPGSFFRRILATEETAMVELVSFGSLGPELLGVQNGDKQTLAKVAEKLRGHGYTDLEAEQVLGRLSIVSVDEKTIQEEVFNFLSKSVTAGDPEHAFDLLASWMLEAAEKRLRITPQQFRDRLTGLGRYFVERKAHHDEWFKTLKPLDSSIGEPSPEDLADEYYRGTAARFSHIDAGLDVRRPKLLLEIDRHFQSGKRVVILHGASGQGKTSLGFRYMIDSVPTQWRFLVEAIDDRKYAVSIALALADHLHSVKAPIYLLVDVAPRDQEWVSLIRELLDTPNIRILVAIREEDLARRTISENQLGFPADVRLEFTTTEAHHVYDRLLDRGTAANAFPSFDEAWARFGGTGPLLEFVYLITQTDSLRAVLEAQVARLRDEVRRGELEQNALKLLHLCAIATAYEARVLLKPAIELLEVADPTGTLNLFEDEYLLRVTDDLSQAESLHPVRSAILADVLDDPTFAPTAELAREAMLLIPEADREVFLLYLFSRHPECATDLLTHLYSLPVTSWAGAAGVARALLWWGIRGYLNENQAIFERSKTELFDSCSIFLVSDIAGAMGDDPTIAMIDLVEQANPQGAILIRELRAMLSDPVAIYTFLRDWIARLAPENPPRTTADLEGWAELLFWSGQLKVTPVWSIVDVEKIPIEQLPLEASAQICQGLFKARPEMYEELLQTRRDNLKRKFQERTGTFRLEDANDLFAHFIVPWEYLHGSETPTKVTRDSELEEKGIDAILNDEAVHRARLLRLLFPGKDRYCTQGYGQQLNLGECDLLHDSSHKAMLESALPLQWLVQVNSATRNLAKYADRPENWREYAARLLQVRETVATTLLKMERRLIAFFKSKRPRQIIAGNLSEGDWKKGISAVRATAPLPKTAVDEWGLSAEGQVGDAHKNTSPISLASAFTTRNHESFAKPYRHYTTAASGFFQAAGVVSFCHASWGREPHRRLEVENALKEHGYSEHKVHLARHNLFLLMQSLPAMQLAFQNRLGELVDPKRLAAVTKRENSLFPGSWALWFQFCEQPSRRMTAAKQRALSALEQAHTQLKTALAATLESGDGWKAKIRHDRYDWGDKRSLVVELQLHSIFKLEESRLSLLGAMGGVLADPGNGTLPQYTLDHYWPQIIVIPTFRGQALEAIAWFIPTMVYFSAGKSGSFDRPYIQLPHPFPKENLAEFGLAIGGKQLGQHFDDAREGLAKWMVMLNHLASLIALPGGLSELDDIGETVLGEYVRDCCSDLETLVNRVFRAVELALDEVLLVPEASHPLVQRGIIAPLLDNLDQLRDYLAPGVITLGDCADLSEKVQEISGSWGLLRWLTIAGVIEDLEALEELSEQAEDVAQNI